MPLHDYFLETNRLGFRKWSVNDIDLALGLWGDFQVTKLFDGRGPLSRKQVQNRLDSEIKMFKEHAVQYWPIFNLETEKHVGCAGLRPYDFAKNILEIGFHIRSTYWRKGYAMEAAKEVMRYAFEDKNVSALFAGHNPDNIASQNLLIKLGFQYTLDELYEPTGLLHPSYLLSKELYLKL